ncbi:multidrug efflux protein [Listeria floridensis FSL S10-1187]|uniref:Probable multidrug resistance protein NorM n=1 Tax=Listeria floridensis FSL S10-1187 TaxID=1265817 RepID=A0ABP3AZL1_9LIST|nr:multidrug efflux protein [Listeria floridensis FSL S10-1187]
MLALLLILVNLFLVPSILNHMGLSKSVAETARHFLTGIAIGIPAFFVSAVLRSFIDSLGLTRISMIVTLSTVPINILLNYLLIFGNFGFPELGGAGSGYATGITYWFVLSVSILLIAIHSKIKRFNVLSKPTFFSGKRVREIIAIGVPNGLTILFETGIFSAVTILMSHFGTETIAAHQSANSVCTLLYAFPLSIASSLTILVGFETGAKRIQNAKVYRHIGMIAAISIGILNGFVLFFFRQPVAELYTKDASLAGLITTFLLYAILFQFADALLSPVLGALRGYKDVAVTSVVAFISYWIIGLPVGYVLSLSSLGAYGFWIGLSTGLFTAAIVLSFRVRRTEKKLAVPID